MSHTQTTNGMLAPSTSADVVMKENAAAAALVDVAAGLAKRASDSPVASGLPTNSASRKQWDQEQAAPSATGGGGDVTATNNSITNNTNSTTAGNSTQEMFPPPLVTTATTAASAAAAAEATKTHGFFTAPAHPQQLHQQQQQQQQQQQHSQSSWTAAAPTNEVQWGAPPAPGPTHAEVPATAHQSSPAPLSSSTVLLSMSSLGFGIDPACSPHTGDATVAAQCAVRDAMERSAVRLPTAASLRQSLSFHLKIGVPPRPSTGEPMHVDTTQLVSLLPRSVHLLPVELVVGGLLVDHKQQQQQQQHGSAMAAASVAEQHPTICTAVACVTLQQSTGAPVDTSISQYSSQTSQPMAVDDAPPAVASNIWEHAEQHIQQREASSPATTFHRPSASSQSFSVGSKASNGSAPVPPAATATTSSSAPNVPSNKPPSHVHFHRTNSMEMLALVSGEIRERHLNATASGGAPTANGGVVTVAQALSPASAALTMVCSTEAASMSQVQADASVCSNTSDSNSNLANGAYSYKKLAPGMTPKNNKRLFVKHSYKDYSHEDPLPDEQFLVRSQDSSNRTPNAAFPLKLHETLTQIEQDGYGHIIGWLPHGRSVRLINVLMVSIVTKTKRRLTNLLPTRSFLLRNSSRSTSSRNSSTLFYQSTL